MLKMKDNITRLAKGNFIYEVAQVKIDKTQIQEEILCGDSFQGEVILDASAYFKGVVYSEDARVVIAEPYFAGSHVVISYQVTAKDLQDDEQIEGAFYFVTSAGEYKVPYCFHIVRAQYHTSIGMIHNLLQFANLLQIAPKEAEQVFLSEQFTNVFLGDNAYLSNMYLLLSKNHDVAVAMEEFLIAAKKKSAVHFELAESRKEFGRITQNEKDQILINKSYWGHFALTMEADAPFVHLAKQRLTEQDFTGNKCIVDYVIEKEKLHAGINTAAIHIHAASQELVYEVEVVCTDNQEEQLLSHREIMQARYELTKGYLAYRMLKKPVELWLEESNRILERVRGIAPDDITFKLMQAQLYIMQQRTEDAGWILDNIQGEITDIMQQNVIVYCYYLYVDSLYHKDILITKQAYQTVLHLYENGNDNWQLLWMLFYLDSTGEKNLSLRLARIKDMFHNGHRSPVMYYEALNILNEQPMLIRVFNTFELEVLHFGCKYGVIHKNLAEYICERMESEKVIPYRELQLLEKLNSLFSDDAMLNVLVTHMVRNELIGPEYFTVYEKGVLRKLRITRLYEYYIASMDKSKMHHLPQMVLRYFAYEANLDYENRAYLYANILTNEANNTEIMKAYAAQIEQFAREQMQLRHIDGNLIRIYDYFSQKLTLSEENQEFFSRLSFAYKITCYDASVCRVIVKHKEFDMEMVYPLVHSVAYIQMYTTDCGITFEDENGIRHCGNVPYEQERVLKDSQLRQEVVAANQENINIQIYLQEQAKEQTYIDAETIANCRRVLAYERLSMFYRRQLTSWLVQYFYENRDAQFMDIAADIRMEDCTRAAAMQMAELFVQNYKYDAALFYVSQYGYKGISTIVLFRLVHHFAQLYNEQDKQDDLLLELCVYLLKLRKYDREVLTYLSKYYNADNTQMYVLWKACDSFDVERRELEERLISQMLFTRECSDRLSQVYTGYHLHGVQQEVQRAYVNYRCYQAFVHDRQEDEQVYFALERMASYGEPLIQVCQLALVRHYAKLVKEQHKEHSREENILTMEQKEFAQQYIDELCAKNHLYAFFQNLRGEIQLPYNLIDKTIIEYRTNPRAQVEIHYARENAENYETETMKSAIGGVFTQVFTLFYGETLRFYFTEDGNTDQQTEVHNLTCDNCASISVDNRYDYMNEMFASKDLHDMVSLKKMMESYCIQDYVVRELFRPL